MYGAIVSFTAAIPAVAGTGTLVVKTVAGLTVSLMVTINTEIEFDEHGSLGEEEADGTVADLKPLVRIAELGFDNHTGELEEIELIRP